MSIIDLSDQDVMNTPDPIVMDADSEVQLRIIACDHKNNKDGNPYILPRMEVIDEPLAKEVTKYLGLPHPGMDEKQLMRAKNALKHFFNAFDVPEKFDPEDLVGMEGWAILGVEESDEYGESNYVKRFVTGS